MENQSKVVRIFSKKVSAALQRLGYEVIATEPNTNCPRLDVYLFRNSGNIIQDMDKIIKENKRIKNI